MDFINTYMPAGAELTQEELYNVRARLVSYCLSIVPDIETNPNSVIGDLIVSPQAYVIAALERGMDRFMSDLDLANIANGEVYNCDFVAKWIDNFVANGFDNLKNTGTLRLTFTKNQRYTLDRSIRFIFGETEIYSLYLPNLGPHIIYRPNETVPDGVNGSVLIDTGDGTGTYFTDVCIVGEVTDPEQDITAGQTFTPSVTIPELTSVASLAPIEKGSETISIPDLAKRARVTMHSASLNTRNGAINYIRSMCPFIDCVYATHNGDREMLRDFDNPFGSSMGCLDLYVRSKGYNYTEVQRVTLYLNDEETAYEGEFHFVGQPYHLESVTCPDTLPDVKNLKHTLTSTFSALPGTKTIYPGAIAAYTPKERMFLSVDEFTDEDGDSLFAPKIADNGRRYATFTITYQTDPMLQHICRAVENEDYRPINSSILVRGFIPVIIDSYEVEYVREPGVLPDLDRAFTEIKEYMGNLGAPDVYSDAEIARIMKECGVKYTKGVNVRARVQWIIGDKLQDRNGDIVDVMQGPIITTSEGLRITYPAENVDLHSKDMYVCSPRNIRYWFMENSLTFKEVRDI